MACEKMLIAINRHGVRPVLLSSMAIHDDNNGQALPVQQCQYGGRPTLMVLACPSCSLCLGSQEFDPLAFSVGS